ncbi:MAG: hypothetical protein GX222_01310 [Ruminococcaceae bacterium]|nr:hypothetical protein [Oscillospiraceae bacterium]
MNLKREIMSLKELILLGILIILVAYYFVVHGPIKKQTAEYENRLAEINFNLQISQQKATEKIAMQNAIDAVFAEYKGNPPITPEYNNINYIIGELNGILGNTYNYHLSFGEETADENNPNIIRRPIAISFSTEKYNDAVSKIKTINDSKNKYLIQDVSITDSGINSSGFINQFGYPDSAAVINGRYNVAMTMTSFEYNASAAPLPQEDISQ